MSKKTEKLIDVIEPEMSFQIEESSDVDGEHVLAKVKGVFFCPNGKSRNNRYYPKTLWEKALGDASVQQKLESKTMFGTVGHETELNDKAIQEGRISHIVTNAFIDKDGKGIGEALILNTPAGRVLNTIMRAGSQVYVSSRAEGRFKGTKDGMPVVDEDAYKLDTWDFVLNPGFNAANPKLVEELNNIDKNDNQGDTAMNETLEKVIAENVELKKEIDTLSKSETSLKEALSPIQEENNHVKEQLATSEEKVTELTNANEELTTGLNEAKEVVAVVEEMGDSVHEVKEALEKAVSYIETLHEEVGTREEIESTINNAISFKEEMDAIGSVEEIKQALKIGEDMLDEKLERMRKEKVAELAEKCNVSETAIEKVMSKGITEDEEIIEFFAEIVEAKKSEEEDEEDDKEDKKKKKDDEEEEVLDEGVKKQVSVHRSRLNRIMEDFSK
jgi:hypothetical protein